MLSPYAIAEGVASLKGAYTNLCEIWQVPMGAEQRTAKATDTVGSSLIMARIFKRSASAVASP